MPDKPSIKKGKNKGWDNLKPAKKGEIRNPKGRTPKVKYIPDILLKIGREQIDTKDGKITKLEAVMRIVFARAFKGENWAVQFVADRTEGKSIERIMQAEEFDELIIQ